MQFGGNWKVLPIHFSILPRAFLENRTRPRDGDLGLTLLARLRCLRLCSALNPQLSKLNRRWDVFWEEIFLLRVAAFQIPESSFSTGWLLKLRNSKLSLVMLALVVGA